MNRTDTVTASPHYQEIMDRLNAGQSCRHIREALVARYGAAAVPSMSSLYRLQAKLAGRTRPASPRGSRRRQDNLRLLDEMISGQEQRIALLWERGREDKDRMPELDIALRTLLGYLRERRRLTEGLGGRTAKQNAAAPESPSALTYHPSEADLKEVLEMLKRHNAQEAQS